MTLSDAIASEHAHWSAEADRHRTALQSCALALESDFQQWLKEANARVEMLDQAAAAIRALEGDCETYQQQADHEFTKRQSAEAKLEAVREKLEQICKVRVEGWMNIWDGRDRCVRIAKKALASLDTEARDG